MMGFIINHDCGYGYEDLIEMECDGLKEIATHTLDEYDANMLINWQYYYIDNDEKITIEVVLKNGYLIVK